MDIASRQPHRFAFAFRVVHSVLEPLSLLGEWKFPVFFICQFRFTPVLPILLFWLSKASLSLLCSPRDSQKQNKKTIWPVTWRSPKPCQASRVRSTSSEARISLDLRQSANSSDWEVIRPRALHVPLSKASKTLVRQVTSTPFLFLGSKWFEITLATSLFNTDTLHKC
jgi:hypothetical protein